MSGSESPSILGGDKITRTQAKKIFKDEVDLLVQGVKSIQVFADALAQMKKGVPMQVAFTDAQGQQRQYQIGRNEYRELVGQIIKRMQKLPSLAFTLNKTRRRTGPNSGFLAPQQFNQDIVNFFAQATLGPQVTGELVLKTDKAMNKRSVPESTSLQELPGTRLNDRLFFTQRQYDGQVNPLYGIIAPGTLTPLFALHANYAENPDGSGRRGLQAIARDEITGQPILNPQTGQPEIDATRLTASNEMRQLLGNVMAQTIRNDAAVISQEHPELAQEAQQKAQQLIAAIQNPDAFVDSRVGRGTPAETEMFNPNYFLYAHFSKLISNGKVSADQGGLTPEGLAALRPQIREVYGPLLRQSLQAWQARVAQATTPEARELAQMRVQLLQQAIQQVPEQGVLTYQQDDVAKARAYKNQVQGAANRRRNAERKRAQAAQQAGAGLPTVPGLPGGVEVGGSSSGSSSGSRV